MGDGVSQVANKGACADDVDQRFVAQSGEHVPDRVGRLAELRRNLLVPERPVLFQQRQDRPVHVESTTRLSPVQRRSPPSPDTAIGDAPALRVVELRSFT